MSYLFHLDSLFAAIRQHPRLTNRMQSNQGLLYLAAPSISALELWLLKPKTPIQFTRTFFALRTEFKIQVLNEDIAHRAAMIARGLGAQQRVNWIPLFIAATALEHGFMLVTHNPSVFARVPGLTLADWLLP